MVNIMTKPRVKYGVTEVARRLNRTPARIRQICIAKSIGVCYGGQYRELTEADVRYIKSFLRPDAD